MQGCSVVTTHAMCQAWGAPRALHVSVVLRVCVEEDAVEAAPQLRQHVLPPPEQDRHTRPPARVQALDALSRLLLIAR